MEFVRMTWIHGQSRDQPAHRKNKLDAVMHQSARGLISLAMYKMVGSTMHTWPKESAPKGTTVTVLRSLHPKYQWQTLRHAHLQGDQKSTAAPNTVSVNYRSSQ